MRSFEAADVTGDDPLVLHDVESPAFALLVVVLAVVVVVATTLDERRAAAEETGDRRTFVDSRR